MLLVVRGVLSDQNRVSASEYEVLAVNSTHY